MSFPYTSVTTKSKKTKKASVTAATGKKGSVTVAKGKKASVTVAAALSLPLFIFALLCLVFLLEINAISVSLRAAAMNGAKNAAVQGAITSDVGGTAGGWLSVQGIQNEVVKLVGADRLDRSLVENGSAGISLLFSTYDGERDIFKVVLEYRLRLPFPDFTNISVKRREEFIVKVWTGFAPSENQEGDEEIVYITATGTVFHRNFQCTHLQLSIEFIDRSSLAYRRNEGGGRFHPCERCVFGEAFGGVYITNHGNRYHNSLNCSGLKRTISAVPLGEVRGRGGCSRCSP